jgi:hypothetical protein
MSVKLCLTLRSSSLWTEEGRSERRVEITAHRGDLYKYK